MNAQTPAAPNRTRSSDQLPAPPIAQPGETMAFTISQRTISGIEHDISELVAELEQLGVDTLSRSHRS